MVRAIRRRTIRQLSREEFCEQLRRILAQQFPDETLERLTIGADLEHSLSGMYARGVSRRGVASVAFLAVPEGESQDALTSCLTYALLWLNRARQTARKGSIAKLRLLLPKGTSSMLTHRLAALDSRLALEIFEVDSLRERLEPVDPCTNGNVSTWLVPRRESQMLLDRAAPAIQHVCALAAEPELIRPHPSVQTGEVVLRFRGLSFARWKDGELEFEVRGLSQQLNPENEVALKQLLQNLQAYRHPLASDTRHELYRAQPERWLQAIVAQDVSRIDVTLDPEHLYEQVFASAAGQRGILDLLGVSRSGRLAILELKASENVDLPLQAADYWHRIRQHQTAGDLQRYGYFPERSLQEAPPVVYLISPALRFHPATDALLKYLSPDMEVIRIGLAET